jgi:hypothetical protein
VSTDPVNPDWVEAVHRTSELLQRTSVEAERADTKASILLAGILAVAGGVSALLSGVKWNPATQPALVQIPWWMALASASAGLVCLGSAVYPRAHRSDAPRSTVGYFGDIVALPSVDALRLSLQSASHNELDVAVDQLWQLSHIVGTKYRLIRWGIHGLCLSLLLLLAVLVAVLVP